VPTVPRKHIATTTAPTTTAKTKPGGQRFWTVQAGDTFGVISRKTGVPVATIEQLNPKVKSTSLFIGEKLRLR
jgi:LysM repeat protein